MRIELNAFCPTICCLLPVVLEKSQRSGIGVFFFPRCRLRVGSLSLIILVLFKGLSQHDKEELHSKEGPEPDEQQEVQDIPKRI